MFIFHSAHIKEGPLVPQGFGEVFPRVVVFHSSKLVVVWIVVVWGNILIKRYAGSPGWD